MRMQHGVVTKLYMRTNDAITLPTNSTSEAVNMIKGSTFRAAIGSKSLIEIEGLKELAFPINDVPGLVLPYLLGKVLFKGFYRN